MLSFQILFAQTTIKTFEIYEGSQLQQSIPTVDEVLAITSWKKSEASAVMKDNRPFLIRIPLDSVLQGDSQRILSVVSQATILLYQEDQSVIPIRDFRKNVTDVNDRFSIKVSLKNSVNGYFIGLVKPRTPWLPSVSLRTQNGLLMLSTPPSEYHTVQSHFDQKNISFLEPIMFLILGGTLMLGCYFGLLYFNNREDHIFGIYAAYLFFNSIYWAERIPSLGIGFFERNIDQTVINTVSQIGFHLAFALLAHELLNFRKFYPKLGKIWRTFAVLQVIYALLFSIGVYAGLDTVILLNSFAIERCFIALVALFTTAYFVFKPHNIYCYFFGFASFSFIVSALSALFLQDIRLFLLGLTLQILTFAFAIGHKIRKSDEARIESEKSAFMLEREVIRTKDAALRAQMNPHFVSNVINALRALILDGENKQAYNYLSRFAHVVRTMLSSADKRLITLREELRLLKDYVALEELRFGRKVIFNIFLEDDINTESHLLPPMLLQPLVENAMHHGLFPLTEREPEIKLNIRVFDASTKLKICIEDNGIGRVTAAQNQLKRQRQRPSMGINIIRARIKLLQAESNVAAKDSVEKVLVVEDLLDENDQGIGTRITLTLPKSVLKEDLKLKTSEGKQDPALNVLIEEA